MCIRDRGIDLISSTSSMRKLASQRWKRNSGSWSGLRCRGSNFPAMIWLNIRQTDTPQRSARSTPKPMIRRVNTSITTMTQWLRRSIDSSIPTVARCRYLTRLPAPMHLCEDLRIRHRQAVPMADEVRRQPDDAGLQGFRRGGGFSLLQCILQFAAQTIEQTHGVLPVSYTHL